MLEKYHIVFAILAGFVLDVFIGDPHCMPHPVRFIGALISLLEKGLLNSSDTGIFTSKTSDVPDILSTKLFPVAKANTIDTNPTNGINV